VSGPPPQPLVPVEDPGWDHGQDLARADAAEAEGVSAPDLKRAGHGDVEPDAAAEFDIEAGESGAVD
jgi:hypothetical protein